MSAFKPAAMLGAGMLAALAVSIVAEPAEWALYDARIPMRAKHAWPADLVHVPITEKDLVALGGWPLPANSLHMLLASLERAGSRTVVIDMLLSDAYSMDDQWLLAPMLDNAVTAITFGPEHGRRPTADELRNAMIPASFGPIADPGTLSFPGERIAQRVARLGHAGIRERDAASVRASVPLVRVDGFDGALPSQALAAILVHHRIDASSVRVEKGALVIGDRAPIPLLDGATLLDLAPGAPPAFSVADLLNDRLGRRSMTGALAVVHVDTPEDRHPTPLGDATPGGLLLAAAIRTLEPEARIPRRFPAWAAIVIAASMVSVAMRAGRDRRQRILACAAMEASWIVLTFALVPLADVFLPLIPALIVFGAGLAAVVLSGPASGSSNPRSGSGGRDGSSGSASANGVPAVPS